MPSIIEQLAEVSVTEDFHTNPGEETWPKLGWANSRGTFSSERWKPPGYNEWAPTHSYGGAYYKPLKLEDSGYVFFQITSAYSLINGASYRSFSVWLFCSGTGSANGYQLRLRQASSGTSTPRKYIFLLYKFVEGEGTLIAESEEVAIETGGAFALASQGGKLTMYRRETEGAEWVVVGSEYEDSTFTEGYSAIDGSGSNPVLDNFGTGELVGGEVSVNIDSVKTEDAEPETEPFKVSLQEGKKELTVKFTPTCTAGSIRAWRLRSGSERNSGVVLGRLGMVCGSGDRCGPNTRSLAMSSGTQVEVDWVNVYNLNTTVTITAFAMSEEDGWSA